MTRLGPRTVGPDERIGPWVLSEEGSKVTKKE